MAINLGPIAQIAFNVASTDIAEKFYGETLGLRQLYRFGNLAFFDCAGVRLMLDQSTKASAAAASALYFRVADIVLARRELAARGVVFTDEPHLIAPMPDHDLWMTFFEDPDGHALALMMEAPKGYRPTPPA
jgi:methylmalonyl-CoA/ethylmalonyl-CoA epimerase